MAQRSRTKFGRLASVFPFTDGDSERNRLHAQIARLCVLHEDLRLEVMSFYEDPIGRVFELAAYRLYFLRRAIGTLQEFSDAIVNLDREDLFVTVKRRFDARQLEAWDQAVRHFKEIKARLEKLRNDIGGHFGLLAAQHALEQLAHAEQGQLLGKIEFCQRLSKESHGQPFFVPLRLHFASHIAGAAFLRNTPIGDAGWAEAADKIVGEVCVESHRHAHRAVDSIVWAYLWERFG